MQRSEKSWKANTYKNRDANENKQDNLSETAVIWNSMFAMTVIDILKTTI